MSDGYSSESASQSSVFNSPRSNSFMKILEEKQQKETRSQGKSEFLSRLRAFELKAQKEKEEREHAYVPKASLITAKSRRSPVFTPPSSPKAGSTIIRTSNYSRSFNPAESRKKELYEEAKAKLENKIFQLEKELEEAKNKTKPADVKEATISKDPNQLSKEISELKEKEEIVNSQLKKAESNLTNTQNELKKLKEQLSEKENEKDTLIRNHDTALSELKFQISLKKGIHSIKG